MLILINNLGVYLGRLEKRGIIFCTSCMPEASYWYMCWYTYAWRCTSFKRYWSLCRLQILSSFSTFSSCINHVWVDIHHDYLDVRQQKTIFTYNVLCFIIDHGFINTSCIAVSQLILIITSTDLLTYCWL